MWLMETHCRICKATNKTIISRQCALQSYWNWMIALFAFIQIVPRWSCKIYATRLESDRWSSDSACSCKSGTLTKSQRHLNESKKKSLRLNLHSLCGLHIDPGHKMRSDVFVSSLSDFRMATARKRCERKQNAFGSSRFNDSRPSEKSIGVMLISFGLKSGCGLQLFSNLSSVMSRVTWDVILKGSMQNCEISNLQKDFN